MARINIYQKNFGNVYEYRIQDVFDLRSASIWIANLRNIPSINPKNIELVDCVYRMEEGNHSQNIFTNSSSEEIYEKSKKFIDFIHVMADYKEKTIGLSVDLKDFSVHVILYDKKDNEIIDEIEKVLKLN